MATSQLGNHCKSKREGDIKGLNDKERKGGQREMGGEDKEERRGGDKGWGEGVGGSLSFYLLTVGESLQINVNAAI